MKDSNDVLASVAFASFTGTGLSKVIPCLVLLVCTNLSCQASSSPEFLERPKGFGYVLLDEWRDDTLCLAGLGALEIAPGQNPDTWVPFRLLEHWSGGEEGSISTFAGIRGERRIVEARQAARRLYFNIAYSTDYGVFPGIVDWAASRVHRHGEEICFNLVVTPGDGSVIADRWRGRACLD